MNRDVERRKKKRKVYVINRAGHDYTPALRFGDLVYLSDGMLPKYSVNRLYRIMHNSLKSSSPDDYILLSGLGVAQSIACSIFALKHMRLNLLLFKDGGYVERKIVLDDIK